MLDQILADSATCESGQSDPGQTLSARGHARRAVTPIRRSSSVPRSIFPPGLRKIVGRIRFCLRAAPQDLKTNIYHFDGLIAEAPLYAKEKPLEKKRRAEEDTKRAGRRRVALTAV